MAGEGVIDSLGSLGNIVSGIQSYRRLANGDILGALTGGIFSFGVGRAEPNNTYFISISSDKNETFKD